MTSYVYDAIMRHIMSDGIIIDRLHHIWKHTAALTWWLCVVNAACVVKALGQVTPRYKYLLMESQDCESVPHNYKRYEMRTTAHHIMTSHDTAQHCATEAEDVVGQFAKTSRQRHCKKPHVVMVRVMTREFEASSTMAYQGICECCNTWSQVMLEDYSGIVAKQ